MAVTKKKRVLRDLWSPRRKRQRSPLAGLAAAVEKMTPEQRKELFREPTPEEKRARDSARRLKALFELVRTAPKTTCLFRTYPRHKDAEFERLDFGEREPSETFAVAADGRVVRHTCQYSGHNGDSYDDQYFYLSPEELQKTLDGLVGRLGAWPWPRRSDAWKRRRADAGPRQLSRAWRPA